MKRILYLLIGGALLSGVAAYAAMARTERATLDGALETAARSAGVSTMTRLGSE